MNESGKTVYNLRLYKTAYNLRITVYSNTINAKCKKKITFIWNCHIPLMLGLV